MDRHSLLPFFFDINFDEPLAFSCQNDSAEPQLYYHGRAVHAPSSPYPAYFNQSETDQNNAHRPLNEFPVASLARAFPGSVDESDLNVMPQPIIDGKATLTIPGSYPGNQSCWNDLEIRETAPANHPDHHLTPLPAALANTQDSRPVAFISQLNLQQPASDNRANSAEIVDDQSLLTGQKQVQKSEHQRMPQKNPDDAECEKICHDTRLERQKQYRMQLSKDPAYRERERQRHKQYRMRLSNDPAYRERVSQRNKERRKNPDFKEREKIRQRSAKYQESQRRYRKKPAVTAKQKVLRKERLKDPVRRERIRELHRKRQNERYRNDPVYAQGRRILCNTYKRMKRKFGKEEASKIASMARDTYLQSVKTPEDSGHLPQNANKNSDLLPAQTE